MDAENPSNETQLGQLAARPRLQGIERNGLLQHFFRRAEGFVVQCGCMAARARRTVVRLNLFGALAGCRPGLVKLDGTVGAGDFGDDMADDLVLDEEDVGYLAIEPVGKCGRRFGSL